MNFNRMEESPIKEPNISALPPPPSTHPSFAYATADKDTSHALSTVLTSEDRRVKHFRHSIMGHIVERQT